jgi:hypothetical protein
MDKIRVQKKIIKTISIKQYINQLVYKITKTLNQ